MSKKIMIAIPCADHLDVRFVKSLTDMLFRIPKDVAVAVQYHPGSLIYNARNQLAKLAVDNEFDYILWLDSDMSFEADLLEKLLEDIDGKSFVSGLYFTRKPPKFKPTVFQKCDIVQQDDEMGIEWEHVESIPSEMFEIKACGFGCVLMKTSLVKDILEKRGLPFSPILGLGEDLSFCVKARKTDPELKLWCDPKLIIGHVAQIVIGDQDMVNDWNLSCAEKA